MRKLVASALFIIVAQSAIGQDNPLTDSESWDFLRDVLVEEANVQDGARLFDVDTPYRAHDAATVPIVISQRADAVPINSAMLVIDENPAPMAADLTFSDAMHPLQFELRVRVNQYSNVRVIAQTADGAFMNGGFVKATGGCSAPASRDPVAALADMGEMRLRHFQAPDPQMSGQRREAQIMIRHPNYSGLQRDQITQLFIGAHFIDRLAVYQGDELLFTIEGGISVSENPVFRFGYRDNGAPNFRVLAHDTEGNTFEELLAKSGGT